MRRFNTAITGASLAIGMIAGGLLMAPAAHAQRYLVNGHPATAKEEQILRSYGFAAGAWRVRRSTLTSFPSPACRSVPLRARCAARLPRDADRLALKQRAAIPGWKRSTKVRLAVGRHLNGAQQGRSSGHAPRFVVTAGGRPLESSIPGIALWRLWLFRPHLTPSRREVAEAVRAVTRKIVPWPVFEYLRLSS